MNNIRIRKHPLLFYFSIGTLLVCSLTCAMLILISVDEAETMSDVNWSPFLFGIILASFGVYSARLLFISTPQIDISKSEIFIGNKKYLIDEISHAILTGKQPFRYLKFFNHPFEGMSLNFKNGTCLRLYDDFYLDLWKLKQFLDPAINHPAYYHGPSIEYININESDKEVFRGNVFFNFRMFIAYIVSLGPIVLLVRPPESIGPIIFFVAFFLFWVFFTAWMMYYIEVSNNYLIIRNHLLFWRKRYYKLSDISQVVFESEHQQPNRIRIICKDYRGGKYLASTLRDKTWLKLKDKLESLSIVVRNEAIYEGPDIRFL